ncbi:Serpentine Receptor, class Z [Caenorhabditis elegans]|uniref:Serpentine Receptor, class Z n=1 Tax=Caenorhabditis elegans TaxID=6239 RepID=Q5WRL3_CAEEL|nr:Serpentine Receptor, class Z [Caenorhabditis elegans]CAH60765.1 Serpentine Receptor, class Z [Caenorhabditis elegans]|eukprot:NP_001023801.1 Serpentine Receptor, class Z [Caenorhabditis elegans]
MNTTLDFTYIPDLMYISSELILIFICIVSYSTLPFYIYVHNLNRHREKDLLIVQLFCRMVKFSYFIFIIVVVLLFLIMWHWDDSSHQLALNNTVSDYFIFIYCFSFFIIFYILHVLQQTFHVILFLLAILNSLKYIFSFLFLNIQSSVHKYLPHFTLCIILKDAVFGTACVLSLAKYLNEEVSEFCIVCYIILFAFLNFVISVLTPFIYIPIMIDINKNQHLHSQQHIYLQNYIFIQSFLVLFFKLIPVPIFIWSKTTSILTEMAMIISLGDVITTPLIIQLSYFRCNVHEVIDLYSTFDLHKFVKVIFCKADNSVHPNVVPIAFSIT